MAKTIKVEVEMNAFDNGSVRVVEIPRDEFNAVDRIDDRVAMLELVFKFGQNEVQPLPYPSVSVGDVVRFLGERWQVAPLGFIQID